MKTQVEHPLYLGVDGGGTKTAAWLGRLNDNREIVILGRGLAGPGNPRAVGFENVIANLRTSIDAAFNDAAMAPCRVHSACLSLAGTGRPMEQQKIRDWATRQKITNRLKIANDAEIVIAADEQIANNSSHVAVALISGTGSIAWGKNSLGRIEQCGGWGYLLGDEGSGYSLALRAVRIACQTADGRLSEDELLAAILQKTGCVDPQQLIQWAYGPDASREKMAALASVVFELSQQSSTVHQIIQSGALHLAELVVRVCQHFESDPYSLALAGGVFCHQPNYVNLLLDQLELLECRPSLVKIVKHPVNGALRIAMLHV